MAVTTPIVAIIGRPNVGKSTLFNRLVGARVAITSDTSGTTRDAVRGSANWGRHNFILTDTAGFGSPSNEIEHLSQDQLKEAVTAANVIVVVVDGTTMATSEDQAAAKLALKSHKPVILAINKADVKAQHEHYERLGIKAAVRVSAIHGQGTGDLLDLITQQIKATPASQIKSVVSLSLLGRPNVGKSSLLNALTGRSQAIVSQQAGTTRDIRTSSMTYQGQVVQVLDTAGLRRRGRIEPGIEKFSAVRTTQAIAQADVCAVIMDATELAVAGDQHIAGMVKDAGKGLILVVNKWDIATKDDKTQARLSRALAREFEFVWWAPLVYTSATTKLHVQQLLKLALEINQRRQQQIPTSRLNRTIEELIRKHPPSGLKRIQPKINYVTQTGINPPTFTFFTSHPRMIHFSYQRYLENGLRQAFDFSGTPIKLEFRSKREKS